MAHFIIFTSHIQARVYVQHCYQVTSYFGSQQLYLIYSCLGIIYEVIINPPHPFIGPPKPTSWTISNGIICSSSDSVNQISSPYLGETFPLSLQFLWVIISIFVLLCKEAFLLGKNPLEFFLFKIIFFLGELILGGKLITPFILTHILNVLGWIIGMVHILFIITRIWGTSQLIRGVYLLWPI